MIERRTMLAQLALGGATIALSGCAGTGRPARGWKSPSAIPLTDFTVFRSGLENPEGIATTPDGRIYLSNGGGAIGVIERDGSLRQIGKPLMPNGVAIDAQGRVARRGGERGGGGRRGRGRRAGRP